MHYKQCKILTKIKLWPFLRISLKLCPSHRLCKPRNVVRNMVYPKLSRQGVCISQWITTVMLLHGTELDHKTNYVFTWYLHSCKIVLCVQILVRCSASHEEVTAETKNNWCNFSNFEWISQLTPNTLHYSYDPKNECLRKYIENENESSLADFKVINSSKKHGP